MWDWATLRLFTFPAFAFHKERMMGIRVLAFTALVAGVGYFTLMPTQQPAIDAMVSASIKPEDQTDYTVSNMENGTACLIGSGKAVSSRSHQLNPGKDCDAVWPGLAKARNWTQNEDGTVVLTDSSGVQVLTLGLGDGVDFESLEPANAVLALNQVN
jgi:hypothetical protein